MSAPFDPRPHLRQLDNGTYYLDVKWRLHWLRSEHPDARIETQMVSLDDNTAVCKAAIELPDGGSATAHGSASGTGGSAGMAHIEQAESRAIGRALVALGYGAEYADEDHPPSRASERPVSLVRQPSPLTEQADRAVLQEPAERPERSDRLDGPERPRRVDPPVQLSQQERVRPVPRDDSDAVPPRRAPREIHESGPAADTAPVRMSRGSDLRQQVEQEPTAHAAREDVSWTKFWEWARRSGYRDAAHLKELLGIEIAGLTPREVRAAIKRYELDNPAPGASDEE